MSQAEPPQDNPGEEELLDQEAAVTPEEDANLEARGRLLGWGASACIHAIALLVMFFAVFGSQLVEKETPPVRVVPIEPPPEDLKPKKELPRALETKVDVPIDAPDSDKPTPVPTLDVPLEENLTRETDTESELPKGREEAVSDSETGGSGTFMAIGAGGGGSGMFGYRNGGGKRRALARGGGSAGSEGAVDHALLWFKRHQGPNGAWDPEKYQLNCTEEGPKCEAGVVKHGSKSGATAGVTGYALLAFLGAGFDHRTPNKFKATVKKGIDYLLSVQTADGLLGERNYEHAIATMALAEAFAMTADPELRGPTQKAVDMLVSRQNRDPKAKDAAYGGLGWDYTKPSHRNDSSVTGWNVMALKSALAGGLNVGGSMEGAKVWLERAWKAWNKDWEKLDPYGESCFPYTWDSATGEAKMGFSKTEATDRNNTPMGALCAVFLGHQAGDPMLETMLNWIAKNQTPDKYPTNTYYMYYNTLAVFQGGGERWRKWNAATRDALVNAQRKEPICFDGSWDEGKFIGSDIGRTVATAYCALNLEVYYRYAQVKDLKKH